jgi:diguanylate cyclase
LSVPAGRSWKPVDGTGWSLGFSDSAYWYYFDVINLSPPQDDIFLEIHYPLLDEIELYTVRQGVVVERLLGGDRLPFSARPLAFRNFLFKLDLPYGQEYSLYLRVKSSGSVVTPILLWHDHDFYHHEERELLTHGLYFGVLLAFALTNLLLYRVIREVAYFYYTLYIVGFGLFQASLFGLGYQYLWPNSPTLQHYSIPLFMLLSLFAALRFAHHFLQLRENCPKGVRVLHVLSSLALLLVVLLPFIPYSLASQLGLLLTLVGASLLLLASSIVWRRVRGEAGLFFFAWFAFLLAVIASTADKLGWGGLGLAVDHAMQLGIILQISILSLALAKRLQSEKQQRIAIQRQTTEELEVLVRTRTAELEQANRRLDAMSHSDGLTGLNNRRLFDEELERQFKAAIRNRTPLSVAMLDVDLFKHINDEYGHLVGDDFLRLIAAVIAAEVKRPFDSACRYGGEEFALILPDTPSEGAVVIAECLRSGVEAIHHMVGEQRVSVTISIGVATVTPADTDTAEALTRLADEALYQAKSQGRNRVITC